MGFADMIAGAHRIVKRAPAAAKPPGWRAYAHHGLASTLAAGIAYMPPAALASYAQMALPGLGAMVLFVLIAAWLLIVDVALLCKGFRSRVTVIAATVVSLALMLGFVTERQGIEELFRLLGKDWQARLLGASIVLVPLVMFAAPAVQHFEWRRQRPHRAVYLGIAVPIALIAIAAILTWLDDHPPESTRAEWQALRKRGEQVAPGELPALRDAFEERHEWGSTESLHLLKGIEHSALIRSEPPLAAEDRQALVEMLERDRAATRPAVAAAHWYGFIEARLLWETLQPGMVEGSIPRGTVLSEVYLLEFIDRLGPNRLCSAGGLAEADRAALTRALTSGRGADVLNQVTQSLDRLEAACQTPRP